MRCCIEQRERGNMNERVTVRIETATMQCDWHGYFGRYSYPWATRSLRWIWQGNVRIKEKRNSMEAKWLSGWQRQHFLRRAPAGDESARKEPDWGRGAQPADEGGRGRQRDDWLWGVCQDDENWRINLHGGAKSELNWPICSLGVFYKYLLPT